MCWLKDSGLLISIRDDVFTLLIDGKLREVTLDDDSLRFLRYIVFEELLSEGHNEFHLSTLFFSRNLDEDDLKLFEERMKVYGREVPIEVHLITSGKEGRVLVRIEEKISYEEFCALENLLSKKIEKILEEGKKHLESRYRAKILGSSIENHIVKLYPLIGRSVKLERVSEIG